jgi:hypothetical protein
MKKALSFYFLMSLSLIVAAQQFSIGIPDSVKNVSKSGSTGAYTISNASLNHNGTQFNNVPMTTSCTMNCKSDYLYFYGFNFNIPSNAIITGVEIQRTRGGCNSGSWVIDTLYLAHNSLIISQPKRDSTTNIVTGTLGSQGDTWASGISPAIVNDNTFGVFISTTGNGICTYGQFDLRMTLFYCVQNANIQNVPDSVKNVSKPNSTGAYTLSSGGALNHNGTQFGNAPTTMSCAINCISDYLYFYDFGFNIPSNTTILGVEALHKSGGCNSGSYVIDTILLVYNNSIISTPKRDSATNNSVNVLGGANDLWGANLSPAIINDNSFGVYIATSSNGICTFSQTDFRITIYYCEAPSGTENSIFTKKFLIYPNPAKESFLIQQEYASEKEEYQLIDMQGKQLLQGQLSSNQTEVYIGNLPAGMYFVKSKNSVQKLIKE